MIYVVSDIHGCYDEFLELLKLIKFGDEDEMYVLGDMVDKGPKPVELIMDLMERPNVYPIMGNHDYMALSVLSKLNTEITEENAETHLSSDDMMAYINWASDGGDKTSKGFSKLSPDDKEAFLEYLGDCDIYYEVSAGGEDYVLVHGGINNFQPDKRLDEYHFSDLMFYQTDYSQRLFNDKTVVTGHFPTFKIREDGEPLVFEGNGHLAIDCGCVYGCNLAAYCLDTKKIYYVKSKQPARYIPPNLR